MNKKIHRPKLAAFAAWGKGFAALKIPVEFGNPPLPRRNPLAGEGGSSSSSFLIFTQVGFGAIWLDLPGLRLIQYRQKVLTWLGVAFSCEPNSKKPNVYAESVASFGNFYVFAAALFTLKTS